MNLLDVRTVIFSHLVTDAVCLAVVVFLWIQNRQRFAGTFFWVADFSFQTVAVLLIVLRGTIPDWLSLGFSNPMVIAGAIAGYMGLERFFCQKTPQTHNYVLLVAVAFGIHYYAFVQPDLAARNLILSAGLLMICFQCLRLALFRVESAMRPIAGFVGLVFGMFCLVSIVRIIVILAGPHPANDFFKSGLFDALLLMSYQMLLVLFTFSLVLMVNQRLLMDIRYQEEKFAKAFRSSPYAITLTRLSDGKILEVNDGFLGITGYEQVDVIGKTTHDLGLWDNEENRQEVVDELLRGEKVQGREFRFRKRSGAVLTGLFYSDIIRIGNEPWILSSIGDITDRKQAEEKLRDLHAELERRVTERTAQLEASNRELEAFSYSVSHDLRTPLRGIDGFSLALMEDYRDKPLDETGRDYLDRVRKASQRMGHLIDGMQNLSRLARSDLRLETIDLGGMVRSIAETYRKNNPDRKVEVIIPDGMMVQGDRNLLKIAMEKLMDNAWKFTGKHPCPRIEFGRTEQGGETVFWIRDNGVGFDMAYADKLFRSFQRLHIEEEFPGMGIGLVTARRVISRHGGRIWAEGEVGEGATVYFTLPAGQARGPASLLAV